MIKDYSKYLSNLEESYPQLDKIRKDEMEKGLGIGIEEFDQYLLFKRGQFCMGIGHDNVGKTDLMMWYLTVLSKKHGLKHCIYSSENKPYSLIRKIFNYWTGKRLERDFKDAEASYHRYMTEIAQHFKFVRSDQRYTAQEVMDVIASSGCDTGLIDPFNSLKVETGNKHQEDYDICANIRTMCFKTNITVYVMAHIASTYARMSYPKDHPFEGHLMAPEKSFVEGGQKFANRADDFLAIHRMTQHEDLWDITELHVRKVKETETGGGITFRDRPIKLKMVDRCRFEINGVDPLNNDTPTHFDIDDVARYSRGKGAMDNLVLGKELNDDIPF